MGLRVSGGWRMRLCVSGSRRLRLCVARGLLLILAAAASCLAPASAITSTTLPSSLIAAAAWLIPPWLSRLLFKNLLRFGLFLALAIFHHFRLADSF